MIRIIVKQKIIAEIPELDPEKASFFTSKTTDNFWRHVDIKSYKECWIWKGLLTARRYGSFPLFKNGRVLSKSAHRIAFALAHRFMPEEVKDWHILHSCDNPPCVNPNHLRLGTPQDNSWDAWERDRHPAGDNHHRSKLTSKQVTYIRQLIRKGTPLQQIAKKYGVVGPTIAAIRDKRTWVRKGKLKA